MMGYPILTQIKCPVLVEEKMIGSPDGIVRTIMESMLAV